MKVSVRVLFLVVCVVLGTANATILFTTPQLASALNPAAAGTTWVSGPGGAVGGIGGPVGFVLGTAGALQFTVSDCCVVGDVFEFILDGVSVGRTPDAPIGGGVNSVGIFMVGLGAGAHTYDVTDITLQYLGAASPFGGGTVDPGLSPAGLTVQGETVPEPSTWALMLGAGIAAAAFRRKRC